MKKGDIIRNLVVEQIASAGKYICKYNDQVIFVANVAPEDVIDVVVTKIKTNFLEARVIEIKQLSPHRVEPVCSHFGLCGGCSTQHISYQMQLLNKENQIVNQLQRIGGLSLPKISPIIGCDHKTHYRNKLEYTFTSNSWLTRGEMEKGRSLGNVGLGYHLPGRFDKVFNVNECFLQPDPSNDIRLETIDIARNEEIPCFDLRKQIGFLRTLVIRTANSGEIMIVLQVAYHKMEWIEMILSKIADKFPEVTSLNYVVNGKKNDTFMDLDVVCWKGKPFIIETVVKADGSGTLEFHIEPKTFYQTNSKQAQQLFNAVLQMADLQGHEIVYDLYSGIGTIALFMANRALRVVGLEFAESSVEVSKKNAVINKVDNAEFFFGDVKELLDEAFVEKHGKPHVLIVDPPRSGMHKDVCEMLLKVASEVVIYVSCNPATQARDLKYLISDYDIATVQPIDMFPQTINVENIVKLVRKPELILDI